MQTRRPATYRKRSHARAMYRPIPSAFTLYFAASFYEFIGQPVEALKIADEGLAVCRDYGMPRSSV
jgi:hypothetical protein